MFYSQCNDCNERWELGTASTCICPEQEPVAWIWEKEDGYTSIETHSLNDEDMKNVGVKSVKPLYTPPPQRTWTGLTDEEIDALHMEVKVRLMGTFNTKDIYRAIEAKLKEKNVQR